MRGLACVRRLSTSTSHASPIHDSAKPPRRMSTVYTCNRAKQRRGTAMEHGTRGRAAKSRNGRQKPQRALARCDTADRHAGQDLQYVESATRQEKRENLQDLVYTAPSRRPLRGTSGGRRDINAGKPDVITSKTTTTTPISKQTPQHEEAGTRGGDSRAPLQGLQALPRDTSRERSPISPSNKHAFVLDAVYTVRCRQLLHSLAALSPPPPSFSPTARCLFHPNRDHSLPSPASWITPLSILPLQTNPPPFPRAASTHKTKNNKRNRA